MKRSLIVILFGLLAWGVAGAFEPLALKAPVPADNPMSKPKIELGKALYFDVRLSKDNSVSCNTCHDVNRGGVDGLPTSKGIGGQFGDRNSPTVFNAAFLSVQFWDGRAATLEDQAKGPLTNPIEMGMESHDAVIAKVKSIPGYVKAFERVFGKKDPVTIDNLAKAIAAYERTLITPNSPFDRYVKGNKQALSPEALEGMTLFQTVGCVACHQGQAFAGPSLPVGQGFYMRFPNFPGSDYDKKYEFSKDLGRYKVTKNESDKNMFRVPTLRNVELTAPYFHNGKVATLDEAVRVMAKTQLNKDLSEADVKKLVAFLKSLTGQIPTTKPPVAIN